MKDKKKQKAGEKCGMWDVEKRNHEITQTRKYTESGVKEAEI